MIKHLDKTTVLKIKSDITIPDVRQVIKELVENSLDAHAKRIEISLLQNGLKSITIEDDGQGIPIDDRPLVCTRYCTSKFTDFEHGIPNYGFRGEALNSICVDCDGLEVFTKVEDEPVGTVITYDSNGNIVKQVASQRTVGTRITINNVFCLKPPKRELAISSQNSQNSKILELLHEYSLCCLDVKIIFKNGDKVIYSKPIFKDIGASISNLYDFKVFGALKQIQVESDNVNMSFYLPDPKSISNVAGKKFCNFFFVNFRPVEWPEAKKMLHKHFRTEFQRTDVLSLIFINLPKNRFQIANTNKKTVYFDDSETILSILEAKLKETYQKESNPVFDKPIILVSNNNEKKKPIDEKQIRLDEMTPKKKESKETKDDLKELEVSMEKSKPISGDSRPKPSLKHIQEYLLDNTKKKTQEAEIKVSRPTMDDFEEAPSKVDHSLTTKKEFSTHYVNKAKTKEPPVEPSTLPTKINNLIAQKVVEPPPSVPKSTSKRSREPEKEIPVADETIMVSLSEILETHLEVFDNKTSLTQQEVKKIYQKESLSQVEIESKSVIFGSFKFGSDEYIVIKVQNIDKISLWCFHPIQFDIQMTLKDLMANYLLSPQPLDRPIDVNDLVTKDHLLFKKTFKWNGLELADVNGRIVLKEISNLIVGYGRRDVSDLCKLLDSVLEEFNQGHISLKDIEDNIQEFRPIRVREYLTKSAKAMVKKRSNILEYQSLLEKVSRREYDMFTYLGSIKLE